MSTAKKPIPFFLVHQETGQRYPVAEQELVIGRTSGDIVFPQDTLLSQQHCRLIRTPQGLGIHDLGSANGTEVNGHALSPEKIYSFKPGSKLVIGEQTFRLEQQNLTKRIPVKKKKRRPKKKPEPGFDFVGTFIGLLLLVGAGFLIYLWNPQIYIPTVTQPVEIISPYEMIEREMKPTFDEYARVLKAQGRGEISNAEVSKSARTILIPGISNAKTKLSVVRPGSEFERRKLELDRAVVNEALAHVTAMVAQAERPSEALAKEVRTRAEKAEALRNELKKLKDRAPAGVL